MNGTLVRPVVKKNRPHVTLSMVGVVLSSTYNSLEIQQCYVFFKQLLSVCVGKNCTVPSPLNSFDRSFYPIGCTNLSNDIPGYSFLNDAMSEIHTFGDFNGGT